MPKLDWSVKPAPKAAKRARPPKPKGYGEDPAGGECPPAVPAGAGKAVRDETADMKAWMNKVVGKVEPLLAWKAGKQRQWQQSLVKLIAYGVQRGWILPDEGGAA